jgi:DNA-binding MarR family transcriptional regulator
LHDSSTPQNTSPSDSAHHEQLQKDVVDFSDLIVSIVADIENRLAAHYASHGLTPPQFYVLKTLKEHEGRCRIGQIAQEHHLTNATMTGLVKRLEAMQPSLVRCERSASDGRSVDVILTPEGEERYLTIQNGLLEQVHVLLQLLPTEERAQTIQRVQLYFELLRQMFPVPSDKPSDDS